MSGSGKKKGGNFFGNAVNSIAEPFVRQKGNFFENILEGAVNVGLQAGTGGLVGYQDGKVGGGITGDPIIDGVKVITGAKAAEDANAIARKNFEDANAAADAARAEQINQTGRDQLRQSMLAGTARSSAASRANRASAGAPGAGGIGNERDFLGL